MNTLAKTAPEVAGVTEQGHWAGALRGEGGGGGAQQNPYHPPPAGN